MMYLILKRNKRIRTFPQFKLQLIKHVNDLLLTVNFNAAMFALGGIVVKFSFFNILGQLSIL